MERTIGIFGQPAEIVDHDESRYLAGIVKDYEPDMLSAFAAFCEPRFNVLDIGANIGLTAIALGRLCTEGRVFAIEASPETFGYLTTNVARAGLANVTCENLAASSTSGQLDITFAPSCSSGGFISEKYQVVGDGYRRYTVRACPIDEYLPTTGVSQIDFIKADVEGFELEVLRGARRTIERCTPVIYCEVNHWCLNVFRRLPLPDFIEELFTFCPHLFAVDADLQYLDLSDPASLHRFYHDHTTRFAYMNLVCGFDKSALLTKLHCLAASYQRELHRQSLLHQLDAGRNAVLRMFASERDSLQSQRDALLNSRSWRYTAPLRRLWALKQYVRRAA